METVKTTCNQGSDEGELSYFHSVGKDPLTYRTIGQELSLVAKENGDREAFVFVEENKRITFKELLSEVDALAAGLQCLGLHKGDRVGIITPNISIWPVTFFASARAGLVFVPLNPTFGPQDITANMTKADVKVLIASEYFGTKCYYEEFLQIIPELATSTTTTIQCAQLPVLSHIIIHSEKCYE